MSASKIKAALLLLAAVHAASSQEKAAEFAVASVRATVQSGLPKCSVTPIRLTCSNMTLAGLVLKAYGISRYQLVGGSMLATSSNWDIEATMPSDTPIEKVLQMLQSLLVERFSLKSHRTSREMQVDTLIVDKKGSKLKASQTTTGLSILRGSSPGSQRMRGTVPLSALVSFLSGYLDRMVIDKTGLREVFDIDVEWTPSEGERGYRRPANQTPVEGAEPVVPAGPSIFTALNEVVGLEIVRRKEFVDMLVIDYVEKVPKGN